MTDPILANYVAVGAVSLGTGLAGKIIFDWLKNRNGNGTGKKTDEQIKCSECSAHPDVVAKLTSISDQQVKNVALHEQHQADFLDGKKEFRAIKGTLKQIGEHVAVLRDRSDRSLGLKGGDGR